MNRSTEGGCLCRAIRYRVTGEPLAIDGTTIGLDRPEQFAPTREIWVEDNVPWETLDSQLPHYARSSVGASPIAQPG